MKTLKSIFLVFLVLLSLFLSYHLLVNDRVVEVEPEAIDTRDIVSYKRFFTVNPNREVLNEIPNAVLNKILVDSIQKSPVEKLDGKFISSNYNSEGFLVIAGFKVPVRVLFTSFNERMPKLDFESYDKFYIDNKDEYIYFDTEKGLYRVRKSGSLNIDEPTKYIVMNESFMPQSIVGISDNMEIVNPIGGYTRSERTTMAESFLGSSDIYESFEENSYLYSSEGKSLRISKTGAISYISVTQKAKASIYEALLAVKTFIRRNPVNFSSYRILEIYESEYGFLINLSHGELPFYAEDKEAIFVNVTGSVVTGFSYNAKYLKEYGLKVPDVKIYFEPYKNGEDPILVYDRSPLGKAKLDTMRLN